jgi:hypothetical protein
MYLENEKGQMKPCAYFLKPQLSSIETSNILVFL